MSLLVDIEKSFRGFSLQMAFEAQDETLALLGASGCGKSMTLRCIAGIERPDRGRIVLNGNVLFDSKDHINLTPQQRKVGLMFQHFALFPRMTVFENIHCGVQRNLPRPQQLRAVEQCLEAYGLTELAGRLPSQLSGGQQQRVALARIMISEPQLLMLDEPFSALDSHLRFRMEQETADTIRRYGKTVLLVTHDRDEVYRMADRVAIVENGHVLQLDSRSRVFSSPSTRAACALTGCKNISSLKVLDATHALALDWGIPLTLPLQKGTDGVGIRMHSIRWGEGENPLRCHVAQVTENPFSYTVMLLAADAPHGAAPIGWEVDKPFWESVRSQEVTVHLPSEALMQLKG